MPTKLDRLRFSHRRTFPTVEVSFSLPVSPTTGGSMKPLTDRVRPCGLSFRYPHRRYGTLQGLSRNVRVIGFRAASCFCAVPDLQGLRSWAEAGSFGRLLGRVTHVATESCYLPVEAFNPS
jgi:hypothetical protein